MPIPQYEKFMTPALKLLKDAPRSAKEILPIICEQLNISNERQQEMLPQRTTNHCSQSSKLGH